MKLISVLANEKINNVNRVSARERNKTESYVVVAIKDIPVRIHKIGTENSPVTS